MAALAGLAAAADLGPGRQVLELAAGSGKFTRLLALTGARVTAVEAEPELGARLGERLPSVTVATGSPHATGLPPASADAVLAAECWHWFDQPAALAEVERLLRPGGRLALLWSSHPAAPWSGAAAALLRGRLPPGSRPADPAESWRAALRERPGWDRPLSTAVANPHAATPGELAEHLLTGPTAVGLPPTARTELRGTLTALAEDHLPRTPGAERVEIPGTTTLHWARWHGPAGPP